MRIRMRQRRLRCAFVRDNFTTRTRLWSAIDSAVPRRADQRRVRWRLRARGDGCYLHSTRKPVASRFWWRMCEIDRNCDEMCGETLLIWTDELADRVYAWSFERLKVGSFTKWCRLHRWFMPLMIIFIAMCFYFSRLWCTQRPWYNEWFKRIIQIDRLRETFRNSV